MALAGLGLMLIWVTPGARAGHDLDHDEIKQLRDSGQILPMGRVMAAATQIRPGQLIEAELEREDGVYLYEMKILAADGSLHKLYLDAATATLVEHQDPGR
jgi:uncharacterized membrane protein YkoI